MKKFRFSLETVLGYKNQILEELKREHALIIAAVAQKETEIAALEQEYARFNEDFNHKKEHGMSVLDAMSYKRHIHIMQNNIKQEYQKLERLYNEEKVKRAEVVEAKIETSSLDKLKEKRVEEYNKELQKSEEIFIEEFVANKRALSS